MNNRFRGFAVMLLVTLALAACGSLATTPEVGMTEPEPTKTVVMAEPSAAPESTMDEPVPTQEPMVEPAPMEEPTPMEEPSMTDETNLTLDFVGLENLGPGYAYEGWLIVDGQPVSTGVFTVDDMGKLSGQVFHVAPEALEKATTFVLTIEPVPDADPAPSAVHVLGGDFDGEQAGLSVAHPAALGSDFAAAGGTFLLGIPTSDSANDSYRSGIWFTGLNLPTLPEGWIYEGWVVGPDGPLSTGRFGDGRTADSDGAGPTAGPKAGPAFPGQDYLNPPVDLTQGYVAVISIEPEPDNSPAPFALKPLVGPIVDAGDHVSQELENQAASFPTGTARREAEPAGVSGPAWFSSELTNVRTGETFSVAGFRGKVVLVETMAIWCSTCLAQQNQVKALHATLGQQDDFVTVVLDIDPFEDGATLQRYAEQNGFDWIYAVAPAEVAREIGELYGAQFLNPPSAPMLIIDRQGQVHPLPFGVKDAQTLLASLNPFLAAGM